MKRKICIFFFLISILMCSCTENVADDKTTNMQQGFEEKIVAGTYFDNVCALKFLFDDEWVVEKDIISEISKVFEGIVLTPSESEKISDYFGCYFLNLEYEDGTKKTINFNEFLISEGKGESYIYYTDKNVIDEIKSILSNVK